MEGGLRCVVGRDGSVVVVVTTEENRRNTVWWWMCRGGRG